VNNIIISTIVEFGMRKTKQHMPALLTQLSLAAGIVRVSEKGPEASRGRARMIGLF
jgi:hypothetical protein